MIVDFNEEYEVDLVNNILKFNKGSRKVRYLKNDFISVKSRLLSRVSRDDFKVLLNVIDNRIVSYMELNVIPKDKYLQIAVFLNFEDFNTSFEAYMNYFILNYFEYEMHYVVGDYNTEAIKYMSKLKNVNSDGVEYMFNIKKEWLTEIPMPSCRKLDRLYFEDFIKLHDKMFPSVFWTGRKLVTSLFFDIYIEQHNEEISSYAVVSNKGALEEEIYFQYSKDGSNPYSVILKAVIATLTNSDSIQILLSNDELYMVDVLKKMGFKEKERIITFHIEAIT